MLETMARPVNSSMLSLFLARNLRKRLSGTGNPEGFQMGHTSGVSTQHSDRSNARVKVVRLTPDSVRRLVEV